MTSTIETTPDVERTRRENAEHGFTASRTLTDSLQAVLVDLIELANQGKQAHWNLVGPNFRDLHLQLDEVIDAARTFADEVAERMRALHATPDGRSGVVSSQTTLEEFPGGEVLTIDTADMITARIESAVATCRRVHDDVDDEDPTSADLLHEIIAKLEQFAWMISAEHRRPKGSAA
ncbi:Dps family protein [Pseudolysinimonas sp.]|uniref:Dps family protein n=1 Tax=Pseudolysinimonas sp. TaxID=2680009 RepID=UPI003F7D68D4